ncbi:MAG: ferredoxin [Sedimenticolaceae bacterium]
MTARQSVGEVQNTQLPGNDTSRIPALHTTVKDAKATRELMFKLRQFHLGEPSARQRLDELGDDHLPALLDPFRDTSRLRYDYPLFLFPPDSSIEDQRVESLEAPLSHWLKKATESLAPDNGQARILKDHLQWIEHHVRQMLRGRDGPVEAAATLAEVHHALQKHLGLKEQRDRDQLSGNFEQLLQAIPEGAQLLGYGRYPSLHLLIHAVHSQIIPRRASFQKRIAECIRGLKRLLDVEWSKSDESIEPRMIRDSVGPGGDRFDPAALSAVIDHSRGSQIMSAERRERIEQAIATLESWEPDPILVRFVHAGTLTDPWLREADFCREVTDADPCACAMELFDQEAAKLTRIFGAVHVASLEMEHRYDPALHDPWFASFGWEAFSQDELRLVPSIIALGSADQVSGDGLRSFSRLLSSGRPVQILIRVQAHNNPGAAAGENPFRSYRTELGYLGISHRQAMVDQSSAARHHHMLGCFLAALDATRTSLHVINTGQREPGQLLPLNAWLVAGAAIEGRAHPFFRINPEAGDSSAKRMDFSGNPQWDQDWPVHPFRYTDENGNDIQLRLAFTFADYCLLIERLRDHFRLIPAGCDSVALVPIQEYLAMDPDQAYRHVPFVLAVDGNGTLHRVVVSRELALACLDRLNFWRTLQEMAGVRNRYVDLAVERTREEEGAKAASEIERLREAHARELERVRNEAAGEAMQRLTDVLLGMDVATAMPAAFQAPANAPTAEAIEEAEPSEQPVSETAGKEADALSFDEPWIDTPLCTSCNDCLKVNTQVFLYNEEKQAYLGDLDKVSYAELVAAAELCPARCIHPGMPQNPDEAGLDELIERAAPFNQ